MMQYPDAGYKSIEAILISLYDATANRPFQPGEIEHVTHYLHQYLVKNEDLMTNAPQYKSLTPILEGILYKLMESMYVWSIKIETLNEMNQIIEKFASMNTDRKWDEKLLHMVYELYV
jgi:hypothetical protein